MAALFLMLLSSGLASPPNSEADIARFLSAWRGAPEFAPRQFYSRFNCIAKITSEIHMAVPRAFRAWTALDESRGAINANSGTRYVYRMI